MRQGLQNIPVFYSEHMLAETDSFSPSASKPRHVLAAWQKAGLPIAVHPFAPVSELDLCLAHDAIYVRGIVENCGNTLEDSGERGLQFRSVSRRPTFRPYP